MDINTSYNIQGLSSVQAGQLERISSGQAINQASDDPAGLAISDNLGIQKSSLSQQIENMNSGIAMSRIAQQGISSQKEILENIRTETLKAMNGTMSDEGREAISNQISKYIEQYNNIADSTNFNGQNLLKSDGSANDDISIVGDGSIIEMERADTTSVSDELSTFMADFTTDPNARQGLLDALDQGINKLSTYESNYGSASNAMESNVRNALTAETNLAAARSTIRDLDYGKEVADFSKTNLQTQIGYLMQTQANAQQAKNIALLS